ncbi:MAG: GNAT family N-acetyltransferase [Proteobacteria bacterium]|nr:GNAT family N-acetyltransferase [Pseudomonadota bacterium]
MNFRRAAPADTERLREIMRGSNGYAEPQARAMIDAYAATWAPGPEVWLIEDERGVAGFHSLEALDGERLDLDLFFIDDARQGEGLGVALFKHMAAQARARAARQVVIVSNPGAVGFYRRMGASDDGVQPGGAFVTWPRPRLVLDL